MSAYQQTLQMSFVYQPRNVTVGNKYSTIRNYGNQSTHSESIF